MSDILFTDLLAEIERDPKETALTLIEALKVGESSMANVLSALRQAASHTKRAVNPVVVKSYTFWINCMGCILLMRFKTRGWLERPQASGGHPMGKRVPASMATRQQLSDLIEGRLSSADGRTELIKLATRLIVEEALEAQAGVCC